MEEGPSDRNSLLIEGESVVDHNEVFTDEECVVQYTVSDGAAYTSRPEVSSRRRSVYGKVALMFGAALVASAVMLGSSGEGASIIADPVAIFRKDARVLIDCSGNQDSWDFMTRVKCCREESKGCLDEDTGSAHTHVSANHDSSHDHSHHIVEEPPPVPDEHMLEILKEDMKMKGCAGSGQSCANSTCCSEPGKQCYTKNLFWAECRESCIPGKNVMDSNGEPWECKALGDRSPGKVDKKECSKDGEDCRLTRCCEDAGMQCYVKNDHWAACKASCAPGPDLSASDPDPWTCEAIGERSKPVAAWVASDCADANENCAAKGCCKFGFHQCYKKDDGYSQCRTECEPGFKADKWDTPWSCDKIGMRTPSIHEPMKRNSVVKKWVADKCADEGQDCSKSQCCKAVNWQCFSKSDAWATCRDSCDSSQVDAYDNSTWDCTELGPRSWGLSIKGWPSLYCFSLFMPKSYEGSVLSTQMDLDAGIFACDGYDIFANEDTVLGKSKDGILVKSIKIPNIPVGRSQDGTAGNAKLFMAVWDKVIASKRFRNYDWTIKADPDAVLVPWRIRGHMQAHVGQNIYVVNCNKFPGSPNFPMMFGSVEIFSMGAMYAYASGSGKCGSQLPWGSWGEDYYMTHCLDFLGVGRINDFSVVGDNVCTGANCGDANVASFHPFKTPDSWKKCWYAAVPQ